MIKNLESNFKNIHTKIKNSFAELEESYLDMVVAGTEKAVLMVESEAKELNEDLMLGAVLYGHQEMQAVIKACSELKNIAGKEDWIVSSDEESPVYYEKLKEKYTDQISSAFKVKNKSERSAAISIIKEDIVNSYSEADDIQLGKVLGAFKNLEKDIVRENILSNQNDYMFQCDRKVLKSSFYFQHRNLACFDVGSKAPVHRTPR